MAEIKTEKAVPEEEAQKEIPKKFVYLIAGIIVIFIAIIIFIPVKNYFFPSGGAVTIDELFQLNLQGKLPYEQGYVYNGFSFIKFDGLWYTEVVNQGRTYRVPFHFGPRDLENVTLSGQLDDRFHNSSEVYLLFDPLVNSKHLTAAIGKTSQGLAVTLNRNSLPACTVNETGTCNELPILNCTETDEPVVFFLHKPGPSIELRGNCMVLQGQDYDIIRAAERALMHWYKIMP